MESTEALDRMREKHARALDQLHVRGAAHCKSTTLSLMESSNAHPQMMMAWERALKAAALDGEAARSEAEQLRRRLATLEDTERMSGRLVRELHAQYEVRFPACSEDASG